MSWNAYYAIETPRPRNNDALVYNCERPADKQHGWECGWCDMKSSLVYPTLGIAQVAMVRHKLSDECQQVVVTEAVNRDWNCTYNLTPMILAAAELPIASGGGWWLDGLTGRESEPILRRIVENLLADPGRYRAMNPSNGWGTYDGLLALMQSMWLATQEHPVGRWSISG